MTTETPDDRAIGTAAEVVAAFVSKNAIPKEALPDLIRSIYQAVASLGAPAASVSAEPDPEIEKPTPAQIKKSITAAALISFVDGKPYKTLKRHLSTHGMSPQQYRARYGLPSDYPMVAPSYSEQRSALAKSIGLGQPGGRAA